MRLRPLFRSWMSNSPFFSGFIFSHSASIRASRLFCDSGGSIFNVQARFYSFVHGIESTEIGSVVGSQSRNCWHGEYSITRRAAGLLPKSFVVYQQLTTSNSISCQEQIQHSQLPSSLRPGCKCGTSMGPPNKHEAWIRRM